MSAANKDFNTAFGDVPPEIIRLQIGAPGPRFLKKAATLFQDATTQMFQETPLGQSGLALQYGPNLGVPRAREQVAKFLSDQYGDTIHRDDLVMTGGASQGLHMAASVLFKSGGPIFMEDPSYFLAFGMIRDDLGMNPIPVPRDEEGIIIEDFERLLVEHRKHSPIQQVSERYPFWSMLYLITVFNNPTGLCYTKERCRQLVEVARKHDILLFSEDVYNILHYEEGCPPPPRLLTYDNRKDADFKGNVISNGTFSKIFAPGLRVGWIESSNRILAILNSRALLLSGGCINHITSQIVASALESGAHKPYLTELVADLKGKRNAVLETLASSLPEGVEFTKPKGGYFIWIKMPTGTDGDAFTEYLKEKYNITLICGSRCSYTGAPTKNYLRISIAFLEKDEEIRGVKLLCTAMHEFLKK